MVFRSCMLEIVHEAFISHSYRLGSGLTDTRPLVGRFLRLLLLDQWEDCRFRALILRTQKFHCDARVRMWHYFLKGINIRSYQSIGAR